MNNSTQLKKRLALLYRYTITVIVVWMSIIAGSLWWNIYNERQSIRTMAENEAVSAFKRDEAFRLFIASRGGVYVPFDERTPSNPYLNHPERDITTTSGKKLTLMNGAYLFRKVMEEFGTVTGVNWRLTSMKPTNSANEPDEWERRTLLAFQQGAKEMIEFNEIKGSLHVRFLSPMVTKAPCLKCHEYQGYKVGEIRGAMGVSLSMAPYLSREREDIYTLIWTHGTIMLLGLIAIGFVSRSFQKRIPESIRQEEELEKHRDHLEELVKERTVELRQEITEREKAEVALRESEDRFRSLFEQSNDAIIIHDMDGRILNVNYRALEMLGYDRKQLLGMNIPELHPASELETAEAAFKETSIKGHTQFESKFTRSDGSIVEVEISSSITDKEKGVVQGIIRDITDRIKLEAQLQQACKMEAIGTLAGGIAHDFNNMLTPIIIQSELALMDLEEGNPIRFNLQEVLKAGLRAKDLVKQILAFSRQSEQQPIPLKITPIIKEAVKLLRASLPTTIEIRISLPKDGDTVTADPTQIHQVMMNLCTNAAHAMRERGGVLDVGLDTVELEGENASGHADLNPGPYLKLAVSDTGHGIPLAVKDRIFDPFFTTKNRTEGTGMGLAVVHGIIKSYGGEITVDSEPGKGATFNILIPQTMTAVSAKPDFTEEPPSGNERVLVVDDEPEMVDTLCRMLDRLGYQTTKRTSSIEALELFTAKPDRFDLVITDQTMPNMTGMELAKIFMQTRSDIPIILCTGFSEMVSEESAKAMGISAFVLKPIVMREIANTIRQVLDQRGMEHG